MSIRISCFITILALVATIQSLSAQDASDSERIEKLERAVEQLQQRNADLEKEVSTLKKQQTAFAAAPPAEGPTKTVKTYDGKTYVEKTVPVEKTAPINGSCPRHSPSWSCMGTLACATNIAAAGFPMMIQITQAIGSSANANVIACASDYAGHCWTTGSLASAWKQAPARVRPT
jgi:hypothetical protein